MTSGHWTSWQIDRPDRLPGYVHPEIVATLLPAGVPGSSTGGLAARARSVYDAVAAVNISYCQPIEQDGFQQLLTPYEVLVSPKNATCIDAALIVSAAALKAGLHPKIVVLGGGTSNHAVVIIWLGGNHGEAAPPVLPEFDADEIRSTPTSAGSWMPIDPSTATATSSINGPGIFEEAVLQSFKALSTRPGIRVVDVGDDPGVAIQLPTVRPDHEPVLDHPYADRPQPPDGPV